MATYRTGSIEYAPEEQHAEIAQVRFTIVLLLQNGRWIELEREYEHYGVAKSCAKKIKSGAIKIAVDSSDPNDIKFLDPSWIMEYQIYEVMMIRRQIIDGVKQGAPRQPIGFKTSS